MTTPPTFDLTCQPWIPVLDLDGQPGVLSLREVFQEAHRLRWLDAEAPPVTAALHRLLIAVLHHALEGPTTRHDWARLWRDTALPATDIDEYLDKHSQSFDLFDAERPFLQCPQLGSIQMRSAATLVQFRAVGSNRTLFDHTRAGDQIELSPAEAARWLVTVQAYDPGGTKTPVTTKNSDKSLCNRFGVVLVEGATLKETLLLNTCEYDPPVKKPWSSAFDDRPAWDAEPPPSRPDAREPYGWLDLLTWPARRVLLRPAGDGGLIEGAVVAPGTSFKGDLYRAELMASFQQKKGKANDKPQWNAVGLEELQGVWRHARDMLLVEAEENGRPRVLEHVAEQVEWDTLSPHAVFTLRVFGQKLDDSGGGSVRSWLQEQLPAPAALLNAREPWLGEVLGSCVGLADSLGEALTKLDKECRLAFQAEPPAKIRRNARRNVGLAQDYWPKLPAEFAELLLHLGRAVADDSPPKPPVLDWRGFVRHQANHAADRLVSQLRERQSRHLFEISAAYEHFQTAVAKHLKTFDGQLARHLP